jgi:NadR type nicotinamide-nucleotide adenylyltransferase
MRPRIVVATGGESTGKSTLARYLAGAYDAPLSPEFARDYLERKAAPLTAADVEPIARGQRAGEQVAQAGAHDLVVRDTDLASTVVYARHYYGACPAWVEAEALGRRGDLYLLCHPDVPWVEDGLQHDRGHRRAEMHALFVDALRALGVPVVDVMGGWAERRERARCAVDALLRAPAPRQ